MITKSILFGGLDRLFHLLGLHLLLSIAADEVGVGLGPSVQLKGQLAGIVQGHRFALGVPLSSEQKRTLSRTDFQVVAVIGMMQRPKFTLCDAVGQREQVAPRDVDVLVAQR
jgi:hypothetical protein